MVYIVILNALDAEATTIIITLLANFSVTIEDNGYGIPHDSFPLLGESHATSKQSTLTTNYYGSDGHSLHSIGKLSVLTILSRTTSSSSKPYQTHHKRIEYGKNISTGIIFDNTLTVSPYTVLLRSPTLTGTLVQMEHLFKNQPVRQRSLNKRKETERIIELITSISLMHPNVMFILREEENDNVFGTIDNNISNDSSKYYRSSLLSLASTSTPFIPTITFPVSFRELLRIPRASSLIHRFTRLYGQSTSLSLIPVTQVSPCQQYSIHGYIGIDKNNRNIQYIYINGRYCRQVQNIIKYIDSLLPAIPTDSGANSVAISTVYILNIQGNPSLIDIVQDPDRTLIQFSEQDIVWNLLRSTIQTSLDNSPWMVPKVSGPNIVSTTTTVGTNTHSTAIHGTLTTTNLRPKSSSVLNPSIGTSINSVMNNQRDDNKFRLHLATIDDVQGRNSGTSGPSIFAVPTSIASITTQNIYDTSTFIPNVIENPFVMSTTGYGMDGDAFGYGTHSPNSTSVNAYPFTGTSSSTANPFYGIPTLAVYSSPFTATNYTGLWNKFTEGTHTLDEILFPPSPVKVPRVSERIRSPEPISTLFLAPSDNGKIISPYFSTTPSLPLSRTRYGLSNAKNNPSVNQSTLNRPVPTEEKSLTFQGESTFIPRVGLAAGRPGKATSTLQYGLNTNTENILFHAELQAKLAGNIQGIPLLSPAVGSDTLASNFVTSRGGIPITVEMLTDLTLEKNHSRVIGQLDKKFIMGYVDFPLPSSVSEVHSGPSYFHSYTPTAAGQLVIIDQHAADERIRLEQLEKILFDTPVSYRSSTELKYFEASPDGMRIITKSVPSSSSVPEGSRYFARLTVHPPEVFEITPRERHLIRSYLPILNLWGFRIDFSTTNDSFPSFSPFTNNPTVTVPSQVYLRSVPQLFDISLSSKDLREFIGRLEYVDNTQETLAVSTHVSATVAGNGLNHCQDTFRSEAMHTIRKQLYTNNIRPSAITRILHSKACRGAVMFGETLSLDRCNGILEQLSRTKLPFQCAHGRPSMVPLVTLVYTDNDQPRHGK